MRLTVLGCGSCELKRSRSSSAGRRFGGWIGAAVDGQILDLTADGIVAAGEAD